MLVTMKPTRETALPDATPPRHHPPWPVPTPCLIPKIIVPDYGPPSDGPLDRALQQMADLPIQNLIDGKPNGIQEAMFLKILVDLGLGKGGIGPEVSKHRTLRIAGHDGLQHFPPVMGAMHIPRT